MELDHIALIVSKEENLSFYQKLGFVVNITITGYAIGTEGVSTNPTDAWNECKTIGNI